MRARGTDSSPRPFLSEHTEDVRNSKAVCNDARKLYCHSFGYDNFRGYYCSTNETGFLLQYEHNAVQFGQI